MEDFTAFFAKDGKLIPAPAGVTAPQGLNGRVGNVDLTAPVTFVDADNRIVMDNAGVFSLRFSMANALWVAQGHPPTATPVTPDHIKAASFRIGNLICQHDILVGLTQVNPPINIVIRGSDSVPKVAAKAYVDLGDANATPPVPVGAWIPCVFAADAIFHRYASDPEFAIKLCSNGLLVAIMAIANALHRELMAGHNWLTNLARKKGSQTARCALVGGAHKEPLLVFAETAHAGHDLWHWLTDVSIKQVACALNGAVRHTTPQGFMWSGTSHAVGNLELASVTDLPASCRDRYPIGLPGKSALVTGLSVVREMAATIGLRTEGVGIEKVTGSIELMLVIIDDAFFTRDMLLEFRTNLRTTIATAAGFVGHNRAGAERIEGIPSLFKYVSEDVSSKVVGAGLAEFVSSRDFNRDGMANMINSIMNGFATAVENLARAHESKLSANAQAVITPALISMAALPTTDSTLPANARERADILTAAKAEAEINDSRAKLGLPPINI